ncbi:terpene synthase family protein [Streptosporangium nondiastaticum]|nr:terpene synthase family protein [Streptosporangium nondiastaticum]
MAQLPVDGRVTFRIPEVPLITPAKGHHLAEEIERDNQQYIRAHLAPLYHDVDEFEDFVSEEHAGFVAWCYPTAKDDRIAIIAEWTSAWLAYDDVFSHGSKAGASPSRMRAMADKLMAALRGPDVMECPAFLRPAVDVMRRMAQGMSPQLRDRYLDTTQGYLEGTVKEVGFRARREMPGWQEYLDMHILAGATWVLDTVEYGQGFDLTYELSASSELREARRIAAEGVVMVNDLFSFRKEYSTGDHSNIVSSFMAGENLSLQGSIDRLCDLIQDVERRFILKQAEVLAGPLGDRADVRAHLEALGYLLPGNMEWSLRTPRYQGAGYVYDGKRSLEVTLDPKASQQGES